MGRHGKGGQSGIRFRFPDALPGGAPERAEAAEAMPRHGWNDAGSADVMKASADFSRTEARDIRSGRLLPQAGSLSSEAFFRRFSISAMRRRSSGRNGTSVGGVGPRSGHNDA